MVDYKRNIGTLMPYILVSGIVITIFLFLFRNADLSEPLSFEGDTIVGYSTIKSIINTGGWMKDPLLGNGDYNIYEHSTGNLIDYIIIKVLCIFSGNVFLISNVYLFLTFLLAAWSAYFVLRRLKIKISIAVVCSILFAFTPYGQMRGMGGHLIWLGCFYIVPLCILSCLSIMEKINWSNKKILYIMIALIGLSNVYYAFFFGILLVFVCVRNILNEKKKADIYIYIKMVSLLLSTVLLNFSSSLVFYITNTSNMRGVFSRNPSMAEVFSLKILNLFLPRRNHRLGVFEHITDEYMFRSGTHWESGMASLGLIGSLGFLVLLLVFLFRIRTKSNIYKDVSWLNVSTLLICIHGGIGMIIAYVVPMIRCYARMSIFIAFYSIISIALLLMAVSEKVKNKVLFYSFLILLLTIGVWDQTETYKEDEQIKVLSQKQENIEYLAEILNGVSGKKIYQFPGETFPGGSYDYMKWYILDDMSTTWSSGSMMGRETGYWIDSLEKLEPEAFLEQLKINNFTGIMFNYSKSVEKYGKEYTNAMIYGVSELIEGEMIYNSDKNYQFIDLESQYYENLSANQSMALIYPIYMEGIGDEMINEESRTRYMEKEARIILNNPSGKAQKINMTFSIRPATIMLNEEIEIMVNGQNVYTVRFGNKYDEQSVCLPVEVDTSGTILEFKTDVNIDELLGQYRKRLYYLIDDSYVRISSQ